MIKINKNQDSFNELKWTLQARSTDKTRPIFSVLCVDENNFVCTDSRRLHVFTSQEFKEINNFENGLYEVISGKGKELIFEKLPEDFGQFPNWKQVMPKDTEEITVVNGCKYTCHAKAISRIYTSFYKLFPDSSISFNPQYVFDVVSETVNEFSVRIKNPGGGALISPILFNYENILQAVIMPIQSRND